LAGSNFANFNCPGGHFDSIGNQMWIGVKIHVSSIFQFLKMRIFSAQLGQKFDLNSSQNIAAFVQKATRR
jgi:hypothetical protein